MKKFILPSLSIVLSVSAFCQSKNNISLIYGAGTSAFNIGICDCGFESKGVNILGVNYERQLTKVISIESGFEYFDIGIIVNSIYPSITGPRVNEFKVNLISIPVYAKFTLLKYLFANVGFLADFDVNDQHEGYLGSQSGIKFSVGVGAKYGFKNLHFFVNPFIKTGLSAGVGMTNLGTKFGVGYSL